MHLFFQFDALGIQMRFLEYPLPLSSSSFIFFLNSSSIIFCTDLFEFTDYTTRTKIKSLLYSQQPKTNSKPIKYFLRIINSAQKFVCLADQIQIYKTCIRNGLSGTTTPRTIDLLLADFKYYKNLEIKVTTFLVIQRAYEQN